MYIFKMKTGIPSEVISEERIQTAKLENNQKLLNIIIEQGILYQGTYAMTFEHEMKFKKAYDYHEITTTITVDLGEDEEETTDETDGDTD